MFENNIIHDSYLTYIFLDIIVTKNYLRGKYIDHVFNVLCLIKIKSKSK